MQAAYFDYLVVDRTIIQPTLPMILVGGDNAILNYSGAQPATKDIQVPPVYFFIMSKFIFYFVFHSLFFEKKLWINVFYNSSRELRTRCSMNTKWTLLHCVDLMGQMSPTLLMNLECTVAILLQMSNMVHTIPMSNTRYIKTLVTCISFSYPFFSYTSFFHSDIITNLYTNQKK